MNITLPTKEKTTTTPGSQVDTVEVQVTEHTSTTYVPTTDAQYPRYTFTRVETGSTTESRSQSTTAAVKSWTDTGVDTIIGGTSYRVYTSEQTGTVPGQITNIKTTNHNSATAIDIKWEKNSWTLTWTYRNPNNASPLPTPAACSVTLDITYTVSVPTYGSSTATYSGTTDGTINYIVCHVDGGDNGYTINATGRGTQAWSVSVKYNGDPGENGITKQINITWEYQKKQTTTTYYGEKTITLTNGGTITAVSVSSVSAGTAKVEKTSNTTYKIHVDGTSAFTASVKIKVDYTITTTITVPDVIWHTEGGQEVAIMHVIYNERSLI